jgi:hypothetical protein
MLIVDLPLLVWQVMAEEQGFEPWGRFHARRFSRPVHSTTLPLLRRASPIRCFLILKAKIKQKFIRPADRLSI